MLTLDAFIEYAEREIPAEELPNYILYAIRVYSTMVVGSSEIMCSVFAPYPEALRWAQNCYSAVIAWDEALTTLKTGCLTQMNHDPVSTCECILQQLATIIAPCDSILEKVPSVDLAEESDNKIFNILKLGLERLSKVSFELEQQDLAWLKEFMDREAENRQRRPPFGET